MTYYQVITIRPVANEWHVVGIAHDGKAHTLSSWKDRKIAQQEGQRLADYYRVNYVAA